jgi:small subunit ribosomal protein S9
MLRSRLRAQALKVIFRTYATSSAYVPPSSLRSVAPLPPSLAKPPSPTFFTGNSRFFDAIVTLESTLSDCRRGLRDASLLPLSQEERLERAHSKTRTAVWKPALQLVDLVGSHLRTSQYRQVTTLLNQLNELRSIAENGGQSEIANRLTEVLVFFEREDKEVVLGNHRRPVQFDEFGRSYTVGRRKESSARVWIIGTKRDANSQPTATPAPKPTPIDVELDAQLGAHSNSSKPQQEIPVSAILINNKPLSEYFPVTADRERVLYPLKLAGLLGAYNIFALVRGGGMSGQAGAASHGIAKGLAAHVPDIAKILKKGVSRSQ